jgi:hypothetical protein
MNKIYCYSYKLQVIHLLCQIHEKHHVVTKIKLPKSLRVKGLGINKKYKVLLSASWQKELYLNAFHPFFHVLDSLQCTIDDALTFFNSGFKSDSKFFFV